MPALLSSLRSLVAESLCEMNVQLDEVWNERGKLEKSNVDAARLRARLAAVMGATEGVIPPDAELIAWVEARGTERAALEVGMGRFFFFFFLLELFFGLSWPHSHRPFVAGCH